MNSKEEVRAYDAMIRDIDISTGTDGWAVESALLPHPAADLFPMMSDEEIDALGADMLEHGQRETIILYHGQILDGRNRYRACILNGIEPRCREELPPDLFAFVASANLHRRHLDESQRAMVASRLATLRDGERKAGASRGGSKTQGEAAAMFAVSRPSVQRARVVQEQGVPDLVTAVEKGTVKVKPAAEFAQAVPPLDQARLIAEHGSPAAAVQATVKAKADRAVSKMPRPVADPKPAADRAETGPSVRAARWAYVDAIKDANLSVPQIGQEFGRLREALAKAGLAYYSDTTH